MRTENEESGAKREEKEERGKEDKKLEDHHDKSKGSEIWDPSTLRR